MRYGLGLAGLILAACGGTESRSGGGITTRDSAGVEVVEHAARYEASLPRWEVIAEPIVDIGGREEPGHDLDLVGDAARLGDGRIVVVNRGSSELRVFDTTGTFLLAIGRRGHGPGEFQALGELQRLAGDSLIVFDSQLRRASLFSPSGQFVSSANVMPRGERSYVFAVARLDDGRFLGTENRMSDYRETSGPVRREPFALVMLDGNGVVMDTVAVIPGDELYPGVGREGGHEFPTVRSLEFGRTSVYATEGRRIYVAPTSRKASGCTMRPASWFASFGAGPRPSR